MEKKLSIPIDKLCESLPDEFKNLFLYSRNLEFEETPDYAYLKDMFKSAMKRENFEFDYNYCWNNWTSSR
jgi:hypothetical protein